MQRVLSIDLWKEVRSVARRATTRKAAVAYVTKDLVGLKGGDVLVVNASHAAIACGETDAKLLRTLQSKGVRIYSCRDLHAKVILLDHFAVIGSGNMSASSESGLVEAGVITDNVSIVSGVASFIEQLTHNRDPLRASEIDRLCKIDVIRRGGRGTSRKRKTAVKSLGNQTWLVNVRRITRDPSDNEKAMIAKAAEALDVTEDALEWVRFSANSRVAKNCREGDTLIQIWLAGKTKRPAYVLAPTPVLLKQTTKGWTRLYLGKPLRRPTELSWGNFKKLMNTSGDGRKPVPTTLRILNPTVAEAVSKKWASAARKK